MSDEGFLGRWSRRKAEAKRGEVSEEPLAPAPHPGPVPASGERELPAPAEAEAVGPPPEEPPPTMEDVAALPPGAEIKRFLGPQVDEGVKRAAFKKLFADPHFNVMDGLDTYIDDYSQPDPIPPSMLRKLAQAQFLGLFEEEEEGKPKASPDGASAPAMPQSATDPPAVPPDEDPDLRLQQDDAAGPGGAGEGPPA